MKFFKFEIKMPLKAQRLLFAIFSAWSCSLGIFIPCMYLFDYLFKGRDFLYGYVLLDFEFLFAWALMAGCMALIFVHLIEVNE